MGTKGAGVWQACQRVGARPLWQPSLVAAGLLVCGVVMLYVLSLWGGEAWWHRRMYGFALGMGIGCVVRWWSKRGR